MYMSNCILGASGRPQDFDRDLTDHKGNCDNSKSFWHNSDIINAININLVGEDSNSKCSCQC